MLCDDLEGEDGRGFRREGTCVYLQLIHVEEYDRNQRNIVKQLSSSIFF